MALVLTEEQSMLRDSARGLISDKGPVSHLRQLRDSNDATGFSRELWKEFAEMGFAGLLDLGRLQKLLNLGLDLREGQGCLVLTCQIIAFRFVVGRLCDLRVNFLL